MHSAADEVVEAMYDSTQTAARLAGGWTRREGDVLVAVSGLPVPTMNCVAVCSPDVDAVLVGRSLDEVAGAGLPYSLFAPVRTDLAQLADRHGLHREPDDIPLMRTDDLRVADRLNTQLSLRNLDGDQAVLHAEIAAAAFEAPTEFFLPFVSEPFRTYPGVSYVVGELDGEPVTTATSLQFGEWVAIFNVGTLPGRRGNGYGAAVTAHMMRTAASNRARWAWLQSSPQGLGVYRALGFDVVDTWQCWVSGD